MTWQEGVATLVAIGCAVWILWTTLRPFVSKVASACGMCPGCGPPKSKGSAVREKPSDLVQITPLDEG